jgi:hypothetical protein
MTFNIINGFNLIAGFKAEIRARLMKKEGQLTSIAMIKAEAMQLELILGEKKKMSSTGTNGNNGFTKQTVLINEVEEEDVDGNNALYQGKRNGYKGQNHIANYQNSKTSTSNSNICTFCHKPGHQIDKCFLKFPLLKKQSGKKSNNTAQRQPNQENIAPFAKKMDTMNKNVMH